MSMCVCVGEGWLWGPLTECDTGLSLAAVHRNLNIPANHCVQSSIVITANLLVSLRKQ